MQTVLGISGNSPSALKNFGISFDVLPLQEDDSIDLEGLQDELKKPTKMVYFQRSRGYSDRHTFSDIELEEAMRLVRKQSDAIIYVDNCYGSLSLGRNRPSTVQILWPAL